MKLHEMKSKLQNYFHNNPKRIALWWIVVHVALLCFGFIAFGGLELFKQQIGSTKSAASFLLVGIIIFPNFPLGLIDFLNLRHGAVMPPIVALIIPAIYYVWFGAMCLVARDTRSRVFRVAHWIFTAWFALALLVVCLILVLSNPYMF